MALDIDSVLPSCVTQKWISPKEAAADMRIALLTLISLVALASAAFASPPTPQPPPAKVALLGDSITSGCCAFPNYFNVVKVALEPLGTTSLKMGCGGASAEDWVTTDNYFVCLGGYSAISLFDHFVLPVDNIDVATILLGTNDVGEGFTAEEYKANLETLIALLVAKGIPRIILMTAPHRFLDPHLEDMLVEYKQAVEATCDETPLVECGPDLHSLLGPGDMDNVHPNQQGHGKIGQALTTAILNPPPPELPMVPSLNVYGMLVLAALLGLAKNRAQRKTGTPDLG